MSLSGLVPENRRGCWLSSTAEQHVTDFDRMINQPADLKSNTDMAVIVSSHRTTAATMNSIHNLLSENHPCTLFMVSLLPATMLHRTKHINTAISSRNILTG